MLGNGKRRGCSHVLKSKKNAWSIGIYAFIAPRCLHVIIIIFNNYLRHMKYRLSSLTIFSIVKPHEK